MCCTCKNNILFEIGQSNLTCSKESQRTSKKLRYKTCNTLSVPESIHI